MKSPVIVKISWSWKLFNFIIQFVFLFIVNIFVSGWVLDELSFPVQIFSLEGILFDPKWPLIWYNDELTVLNDNTSLNSTLSKSEWSIEFIKQLIATCSCSINQLLFFGESPFDLFLVLD